MQSDVEDAKLALKEMKLAGYDVQFPEVDIFNKKDEKLVGVVQMPYPQGSYGQFVAYYQLYHGEDWSIYGVLCKHDGMLYQSSHDETYDRYDVALARMRYYVDVAERNHRWRV
jgi:hypothetical protein